MALTVCVIIAGIIGLLVTFAWVIDEAIDEFTREPSNRDDEVP